jgi:hypothetical protein
MSNVRQFPNHFERAWFKLEADYRPKCRAAGAEPALEEYLIARLRRLYDRLEIHAPAAKSMEENQLWVATQLFGEVVELECALWRAGVPQDTPAPMTVLES